VQLVPIYQYMNYEIILQLLTTSLKVKNRNDMNRKDNYFDGPTYLYLQGDYLT